MSHVTSYRPADGLIAGSVRESAPDEVEQAVRAAVSVAPQMSATSPLARRRWLVAIADTLVVHTGELAALAETETGLGLPRLTGEVARAAAQMRFYAEVAVEGSWLGLAVDSATVTSPRLVRVNQPLGPVAVFGASNFPFGFGVLGNDTASALAAGCPVVAKAHPAHPLLSMRLAELATQALRGVDAPEGVFSLVTGMEAGITLVGHPGVSAVGFTGSQRGGLALWRLANERDVVIPVYAEMGTINPAVMTTAALVRLTEIAAGFVGSFTLGAGQFCTKPGLLLAPAGHHVAEVVVTALEAVAPTSVMLTEQIAALALEGVVRLEEAGARVVGRVQGSGVGWSADAVVLAAPAAAFVAGSTLTEECFGPVALVVEYASPTERDEVLAALQGGLVGTVVTDGTGTDPEAADLVNRLAGQVGRVTVDDWPTGVAWTWAQQHGGPWPATSNPATTSVGAAALDRWVRPVAYQSVPEAWLPRWVHQDNPWHLPYRFDGRRVSPLGAETEEWS